MKIRLGIIGLLLVLLLVLWMTTPSSPWSNEGFDMVNTQVIRGRYIRLENKQVGCMNLADIAVYSDKNGKNIIQPSIKITKSSPYGNPDQYPEKNLMDENTNTMLVTSCQDAPSVLIDLGSVLPIYKVVITNRKDCCRQRANGTVLSILDNQQNAIFVSNPIKDKKQRITYEENNTENNNLTDYYYTFTYFPPYPVPFGDLSPSMTMDPPTSIDSVPGWSPNSPHMNPSDMVSNETVESCRQRALNGNYVAWGYRKDNHPSPEWRNTCYLYTDEMKPYSGNPQDNIHLTGCLRPGEKMELGCKVPNDPNSYQPNDRLKCRTLSTPFNEEGLGNAIYLDRHDVRCDSNEVLGQFRLVREGNEKGPTGRYRYDYTCCRIQSPAFSDDQLPSSIQSLPDELRRVQSTIQAIQAEIQKPIQSASLPAEIKEIPSKLAIIQEEVKRIQTQLQKPITDSLPLDVKDTPAKLAVIQTELKQMEQKLSQPSLPSAIQEAPTKLAALEAEVQRIQQQLQKSSTSSSTIPVSAPAPVLSSPTSSLSSPSFESTQSAKPPVREDIIPQTNLTEIGSTAKQLGTQSSLLRDIQEVIRNEIYANRSTTPLVEGFF
jgi:uncharacterized small protein (DUF1192 family)